MTVDEDPASRTARVPYFGFLGLQPTADDATWCLPGSARHVGDAARQSVHGGVLAAFLESSAALHLRAAADRVTTVDFTSDFLREAVVADLFATVTVVRRGRRFANVRVDAWQSDRATLVAVGHGNFLLHGRRP